ncbi:MAG: HlyD family type I secretion periplasmic adaptor subunit [Caulobacteraceae bacterium]
MNSPRAFAKPDPIFGGRPKAELAFLPAALEIVETPAPPLPRVAALALTGLLGTAIAWACLGQVDIVAPARGKLVPTGGGKVVQPLETGLVTAIAVRDGQTVKKGQLLVALEPTESEADRDRLKGELSAAQLEAARLHTVSLGAPFAAPRGADPAAAAIAREEAAAARAELGEKVATLDRQIEQRRAEIAESKAQEARLSALLPFEQKAVVAFEDLDKAGFASKLKLAEAQEKAEDTARQLAVQKAKTPELEAEIAALERQRAETLAESTKTNLGSLADAKVKAASLQQQVAAAEQRLRTRSLAAPADGTVQELAIHTVGGVVEPGQTLMRIAPAGSSVEVEAKLSNQDVGFVRAGMPAVVKVETFPFTRYGVIKGEVLDVSGDAVSDKRSDGSEELTYMMHVRLDRDTMEVDGHSVRLTSGMAVTAEVKTGRRRLIEYVLSPLAKAVGEAGRER